jgi:hypothetical protein
MLAYFSYASNVFFRIFNGLLRSPAQLIPLGGNTIHAIFYRARDLISRFFP